MKNQITIKDKQGNIETVDLIAYFKIKSTNKNYVFYTKNEVVQNGLIKIYVIEVGGNNTISDDEWMNLKKVMQGMITNTTLPDVEVLSTDGVIEC